MRFLYTFLFYLLLPFVFLRLLWRSRKNPAYRQHWAERMGFCPHEVKRSILIHAASVGETLASAPLVKALEAQYPGWPIVFTTMTVTGRERAGILFKDRVIQSYIPYDLPGPIHRFFNRTHPAFILVIETELWPNLFAIAKARGIPLMVANARLSEKSAEGYSRVARITDSLLKNVDVMAVQTQVEAERFISLGLPQDKAIVTGSIKFDIALPEHLDYEAIQFKLALGPTRLIWVAASTHPGEEEIILNVHRALLNKFPSLLLILVPRHPERFHAVHQMISEKGFNLQRRSANEKVKADTQVFLGDTMGELLLMYAVSDIAFVAGSFVPVGGHNMLEAAVLGKPIIVGPYLFNFLEISDRLIREKGMIKTENEAELLSELRHLLANASLRDSMGQNARRFLEANRGAVSKHMQLIQKICENVD